uniref:Probable ATP-dependent RNA helicase spindle-E n=1 Tax=Anopheles atroparvus TaxID=41427 RepID=A0A182IXV3_ANOAO
LQRKLTRLNRDRSNNRKPAAVTSTRVEALAAESTLGTPSSETNEQIPSTSEAAIGGSVDLAAAGSKPFPVPIHPPGNTGEVKQFFNEEQCVLSHLRHHRVLVHGYTALKPIVSITTANFCQSVHQALAHFGIRMVYRLQAYSWPHIMRGNSLVCVNSAGTGKTFAYLPAVCSLIKMHIEDRWVLPDAGPIGIIVCTSSMEVQRVGFLCRRMLNSVAEKQMSVLECYGIRLVYQVCNKLLGGCAILVTTAPAYRRLYEAMPEAFVRKRLAVVVIDNVEQMLQHFGPDLQLLCKNCDKPDLQMIVTAGHWDPTLRGFLLRYSNMIALIGAYLEAAVYAQVQFRLRLRRNDDSKQHELVRYIRKHDYRTQRTIVFCSTADDVARVVETLRQHSIHHLVCSASTIVQQHDGFRHWDDMLPGDIQVLVCLDEVFGDLRISKAQHIVHYSLPDSWTCFTRRFATSFDYFEFPERKRAGGDQQLPARPSTLVLVDENNNQQLPRLIDFLELHHVEFPAELSALAQNIRNAIEYGRVNNGRAACALCPQLLARGYCRGIRSCAYRHALMEFDLGSEDSLPACGAFVRLNICHVFSPVHFSARLEAQRVGYAAASWTPLFNPNEFFLHDMRLQAHFANPARHQLYGKELLPNDLCALFHDRNYWRCRIVHFEADGDSTTIGDVQLKLIDTGRMVNTKSTNLLSLPDQFHALPGQAIEVRIAGVVPHDLEDEWDQDSTKHVQRWIDDYVQQPHHYVQGEVLLALRDTIWIDELMLTEQLDSVKTTVVSTKIKSSIVSKQFGVYDTESFARIQQMVQKFEAAPAFVLPESEKQRLANMPTQPDTMNTSSSSSSAESGPGAQINELAPEPGSVDSAAVTSKQTDVVRDAISPNILESLLTTPDRQTPLAGEHSKRKSNSISSTSSFEILSPTRDEEKEEEYRFEALEKGKQYNVVIGQYFAPDLFYVYQIDTMIPIHEEITAYTANASNIKPLAHLQVGGYCLFDFEETYRRGRIVEVSEKATVKVFLLDFGGTILSYPESLIEIPNHLLRDYPFAAIEAKLGLIEPLEGSSTWTAAAGDAIYDDVLGKYNERGMVAHVLQTLGPRPEADAAAHQSVEGCHRYELLLADPDSSDAYSIVSELAQSQLAMMHWEKQDPGTDVDDEEEDGSFVQLDFTHDELRSILCNITKEQPAAVSAAAAAAAVEPNKDTPVASGSGSSSQRKPAKDKSTDTTNASAGRERAKSSTEAPATKALPRLQCDFRMPQTVWWQADGFIMLYVSAPDVVDYRLVVNMRSVLLQFFRNDQPYAMALNLFGPIDPEHTVHEVRGLCIVIRLARLPGSTWRWPYLLNVNVKFPWLKQAIDPPRYRRTGSDSSDEWSASGSESFDESQEIKWSDLLPTRLDDMFDFRSNSSEDEENDDLGLLSEGAMEDELFYHR